MASRAEIRERLFNLYAANLTSCLPHYTDTFVCPLCRYCFTREALADPPSVILAHCIPDSLRGRLMTLACAECDTGAGRSLDNHAKRRFENADFRDGFSPDTRRTWLFIGGLRVRADLQLTRQEDGTIQSALYGDKECSPKADFEALEFGLESGVIDTSTTIPEIAFDRREMEFDWRNAQVSILRSAFLMMFRFLGYSYVLHPRLERVWQQLMNPQEHVLPCLPIVNLTTPGAPSSRVVIVKSPADVRAFAAIMRFVTKGERAHHMAVLMPGLDDETDTLFDRIADEQKAGRVASFQFTPLGQYRNVLSDPNSCKFPSWLWLKYAPRRSTPSV